MMDALNAGDAGLRNNRIGNEIQTENDFTHAIESRFGKKYKKAWVEAARICKSYDKGILLSQRHFYETVYKPRRDDLAEK